MANKEARQQREMYVVKANDLIQYGQFNLSVQQQKLILYMISMIRPEDDVNTQYNFSIPLMCQTCGYYMESGYYYEQLKKDLLYLWNGKPIDYIRPNGDKTFLTWIQKPVIKKGQTEILIRFDEDMQPYLFQLRQNYTQYMLQDILVFKNKYAIRIYELLKSYIWERKLDRGLEQDITIDLSDLTRTLKTPNSFTTWTDIKRFVIMPAVNEINTKSDKIHIDVEPIMTKGRGRGRVTQLNFIITAAKAKQIIEADRLRGKILK